MELPKKKIEKENLRDSKIYENAISANNISRSYYELVIKLFPKRDALSVKRITISTLF